jgi:hypothetical protein
VEQAPKNMTENIVQQSNSADKNDSQGISTSIKATNEKGIRYSVDYWKDGSNTSDFRAWYTVGNFDTPKEALAAVAVLKKLGRKEIQISLMVLTMLDEEELADLAKLQD